MKLKRMSDLSYEELEEVFNASNANYEIYEDVLDRIIEMNIEHEMDELNSLKGLKVHSFTFGSVYADDHSMEVTSVEDFVNNKYIPSDNEETLQMIEELKNLGKSYEEGYDEEKSDELIEKILCALGAEIDDRAMMENYGMESILYCESDQFTAYFEFYDWYVDLDTNKLYHEYELEEQEIAVPN